MAGLLAKVGRAARMRLHMPLLHSQHIIWTDIHVLSWRLEDLEREVSEWVVR